MSLTLREDWRHHIRMAARDLGVKHIRGHGLLDDDIRMMCQGNCIFSPGNGRVTNPSESPLGRSAGRSERARRVGRALALRC